MVLHLKVRKSAGPLTSTLRELFLLCAITQRLGTVEASRFYFFPAKYYICKLAYTLSRPFTERNDAMSKSQNPTLIY